MHDRFRKNLNSNRSICLDPNQKFQQVSLDAWPEIVAESLWIVQLEFLLLE
jgi:hypothetical protein